VTINFSDPSVFTISGAPDLSNVTLVTEEIILSQEERIWIQTHTQEQIVTCVTRNPIDKTSGSFSVNLVTHGPVKCMYWFFNREFPKEPFNFSNVYGAMNESDNQLITDCSIYLNNIAIQMKDPNYFKFAQPVNHNLTVPSKNIYVYSFCLNAKNPAPNGALDFSQLDSNGTKITGNLISESVIHIYFSGYNLLRYQDGKVSLGFI
jgi:hypothetical protein